MTKNENSPELERRRKLDLAEFSPTSLSEWKEAAIQGLKGAPYDKVLRRKTLDGLILDAIYSEIELRPPDALSERLLRGMAERTTWDISQTFQCDTPDAFAIKLCKAMISGQSEIRLVVSAQLNGHANTNTLDEAVAISAMSDLDAAMPTSLPGISAAVSVRFLCGTAGLATLAFWQVLHAQRGWRIEKWRGSLGFAPIGALALTGTISGSLMRLFDEAASVVGWMARRTPDAKALLVDGTVYHNGGAGGALEMACCLAEAAVYMRELADRGIPLADVAGSISIQLATGDDFFEDIAKLRGMRLLFGGLARALGCDTIPIVELWSRTSALFATTDEPLNNVLRSISATLSGALGGAASIHAAPFNETYATSDEFAVRISRNIQLILQKECRIGEVTDPCGGAYYIEHLTDALSERAWNLFCEFEAYPGGYLGALRDGRVATLVNSQFAERQHNLNKRRFRMVGVNDFVAIDAADNPLKAGSRILGAVRTVSHKIDGDPSHFTNDGEWVAQAEVAAEKGDSFQQINMGAKGEGTIQAVGISARRLAEGYEGLRKEVATRNATKSSPCSVLLLRSGSVRDTRARADFSRGFFNAAGFEIIESPLCATVTDACREAINTGADITVICSTDDRYREIVAELAAAIRRESKTILVLAGRPFDLEDTYRQSGIDEFIFLGADHYTLLEKLIAAIGESHD